MALGMAMTEQRFESPRELLGERLRGVYRLLADHGSTAFPDDYFADLYKDSARGRPTVPARVLATTMVLQAHEGLSDREACDRLERDLAWQAAAGVHTGSEAFHPTVLVGQRNRLRASARPRRLFEDTKVVARSAGLMGRRVRVLDSTPIYDSVATQDTVTQLHGAIRRVRREAPELGEVRLRRRYQDPRKPECDWPDPAAREALVSELVSDTLTLLRAASDRTFSSTEASEALGLLALVAGQDVEPGEEDGTWRIVRGVAPDRIVSTVDPEARHGHKSRTQRVDGYKAHFACEPRPDFSPPTA